jgi:hypothetical protein
MVFTLCWLAPVPNIMEKWPKSRGWLYAYLAISHVDIYNFQYNQCWAGTYQIRTVGVG